MWVRVQCCFTSTETTKFIRDGEPRTATLTFTQLLSLFFFLQWTNRSLFDLHLVSFTTRCCNVCQSLGTCTLGLSSKFVSHFVIDGRNKSCCSFYDETILLIVCACVDSYFTHSGPKLSAGERQMLEVGVFVSGLNCSSSSSRNRKGGQCFILCLFTVRRY